jgi:hypothetical protein
LDRLADGTASSRLRGSRGCHTGCVPIIWGPYSLVAMLCSERGFGAETPMGWLEADHPASPLVRRQGALEGFDTQNLSSRMVHGGIAYRILYVISV